MADTNFLRLKAAAEMVGVPYETLRRRVHRYREREPESGLVNVVEAVDGGRDRLLVSSELLAYWYPTSTEPAVVGPERDGQDHLRVENELLEQSTRHLEIRLHAAELEKRDADIERLEAAIGVLETEKALLHQMLTSALSHLGPRT